jgi:CRISPR-associated endonuclease Csn1
MQHQNAGVRVHNETGIADNGGIVRSDVFTKDGKIFIIPIYQNYARKGMDLPMKAHNGATIDDSYEFMFSLFSDDLIKVIQKDESYFAYFNALNFNTGQIIIEKHDKSAWDRKSIPKVGAKPIIQKTLAINTIQLEKWSIDVVGNKTKIHKETRLKFI